MFFLIRARDLKLRKIYRTFLAYLHVACIVSCSSGVHSLLLEFHVVSLIHQTYSSSSQDRATLGRAYSAGISNVGVFKHPTSYGDLNLREVYFGISQTVSAPAVSVSAATVGGNLCLAFHTATPLWPQSETTAFADNFVRTLELAAATELEGAASSE